MKPEEYMLERVDDQISWYDGKSGNNKCSFALIRIIEICAAATIPFLSGIANNDDRSILICIGVLGIVVTICAATSSLLKFQENWIEYRTTAESLKKEKFLYATGINPYDSEDAFPILVQRVETLVSKENTNWAQYMTQPGKENNNGDQNNLH
jgi:Protein of unknown function (DUF4231)